MQFKSALKKILLRASVTASKYSNCLSFDVDNSPPIFSLKWTKNRSTLSSNNSDDVINIDLSVLDRPIVCSENKENAIAYIGGWVVRKLSKSIDCAVCCDAMIATDKKKYHLSLISIKDNG